MSARDNIEKFYLKRILSEREKLKKCPKIYKFKTAGVTNKTIGLEKILKVRHITWKQVDHAEF